MPSAAHQGRHTGGNSGCGFSGSRQMRRNLSRVQGAQLHPDGQTTLAVHGQQGSGWLGQDGTRPQADETGCGRSSRRRYLVANSGAFDQRKQVVALRPFPADNRHPPVAARGILSISVEEDDAVILEPLFSASCTDFLCVIASLMQRPQRPAALYIAFQRQSCERRDLVSVPNALPSMSFRFVMPIWPPA